MRPPVQRLPAPTPAGGRRRREVRALLAAASGLSTRSLARLERARLHRALRPWLDRGWLKPAQAELLAVALARHQISGRRLAFPGQGARALIRAWHAGQLPWAARPARARAASAPTAPAPPLEPWMLEPRLLDVYCALAGRVAPTLAATLRHLRLLCKRFTRRQGRPGRPRAAAPGRRANLHLGNRHPDAEIRDGACSTPPTPPEPSMPTPLDPTMPLRAELDTVERALARLRAAAAPEPAGRPALTIGDLADAASRAEASEASSAELERLLRRAQALRAALARAARGAYGQCEDCGQTIAPARLAALPHATTCRPCQELRERASAVRDDQEA
jgi:DnaK suppressor protein